MAAPGDRRGCVADPPLFESPAAAAGGAGCIVFGGVCQDLQLAEYVHGLPGGAPAGDAGAGGQYSPPRGIPEPPA